MKDVKLGVTIHNALERLASVPLSGRDPALRWSPKTTELLGYRPIELLPQSPFPKTYRFQELPQHFQVRNSGCTMFAHSIAREYSAEISLPPNQMSGTGWFPPCPVRSLLHRMGIAPAHHMSSGPLRQRLQRCYGLIAGDDARVADELHPTISSSRSDQPDFIGVYTHNVR